jgi:hypothetical protein
MDPIYEDNGPCGGGAVHARTNRADPADKELQFFSVAVPGRPLTKDLHVEYTRYTEGLGGSIEDLRIVSSGSYNTKGNNVVVVGMGLSLSNTTPAYEILKITAAGLDVALMHPPIPLPTLVPWGGGTRFGAKRGSVRPLLAA